MKCYAKPLAACLLTVAAPVCAQSSVTLYGRLNTALESSWISGGPEPGSAARMTNNRSVFGLRGTEWLGDGTSAIFQIESGIALNTGQGQIASRNTRVGFDGPYGTLFLGNWHTPYTEATLAYDPYYATTAAYMALLGNGSAASTGNVENTSSFDRRQNNSLQYRTPSWQGLSGGFAWGLPQEKMTTPRNPQLFSWSGSYDRGGLNLALAYELHRNYQAANTHDDAFKMGLSYQFPTTRVAVVYERLRYRTASGSLTRDGYYVSIVQALGRGSLRAALGVASNGRGASTQTVGFVRSGSDTGAAQWTVGYDYPLSPRTALYGYYSRISNRARADYDFAINSLGVTQGTSPQTLAIGLRHNF